MFDIKAIRDDAQAFDAGLAKRGLDPQSARLIEIDERRRKVITSLQEMQQSRNDASKLIGQAKAKKDEDLARKLMDEVASLKSKIQASEEEERAVNAELHAALASIPNIPLDEVPVGADESANVVHHEHGAARQMNFEPKEHFDLGEALGLMDFETAAKLSGARFSVLKGPLARLERAIGNFMVDLHTSEFGYTEVMPPLMVRDEAMFGTAQLPKFEDDQFATFKGLSRDDQEKYWLIPTAEVPLTNLVRETILSEEELPKRFTAYTACFRAEAGAAGRDTRGLIRQHQFSKVELVSITTPEASLAEHERMVACAEEVLQRLDLHYRVMTLSTGDMGFASRKTYDIEVWLPGQNAYREISSCSVCGDFQARRMNARFRPKGEKNTRF
ncbi:serine--tRNA ligase, partial [Parvibaculum sp.]